MFGGIGGFRNGLEKTGNYKCVGYCDNNKYAVSVYNRNFNETHKPTDVTTVDWKQQPDFDMLCAGFPCQSFSVAGKRLGFKDTRGTMFFEIARCVREKQPRILLLENVKGILSHDQGNTFAKILSTLDELGYDAEWKVINSKNHGVAQNRERVFIVGHSRGSGGRKVFPVREITERFDERDKTETRQYEVSPTIDTKVGDLNYRGPYILKRSFEKRTHETPEEVNEYLKRNKGKHTIKEISDFLGLPKTKIEHYFRIDSSRAIPSPDVWEKLKKLLCFDDTYDLTVSETYEKEIEFEQTRRVYDSSGLSPTLNATCEPLILKQIIGGSQAERVYDPNGLSSTLSSQGGGQGAKTGLYLKDSRIRRLTPIECERLQNFPDGWTKYGQDGETIRDSQRYKMLGNAVTTNVIEYIGQKLDTQKNPLKQPKNRGYNKRT